MAKAFGIGIKYSFLLGIGFGSGEDGRLTEGREDNSTLITAAQEVAKDLIFSVGHAIIKGRLFSLIFHKSIITD